MCEECYLIEVDRLDYEGEEVIDNTILRFEVK